MRFRRSEVMVVVVYFVVLVPLGACGYRSLEGWTWHDSFFMTVITITAVGYDEVNPLTQAGRYWTTFVLAGGLTGLGMWFALVTASMVRMDLGNYSRRRTMKKLDRLRDHMVVCGGGRMGMRIVRELRAAKRDFVVVERDEDKLAALRQAAPGAQIYPEDATKDRVLRAAGIERAKGLVACLSADTDNLYVCLSARHLNPDLVVIARAEGETATAKMYRAGADHVVSPSLAGAVWVASVLVRPWAAKILDVTTPGRHVSRRIQHATVGPKSRLVGKTLAEARIPAETGLLVIALRQGSGSGEVTFNPGPAAVLGPGDDLVVMGDAGQVAKLRALVA